MEKKLKRLEKTKSELEEKIGELELWYIISLTSVNKGEINEEETHQRLEKMKKHLKEIEEEITEFKKGEKQ